MRRCEAHSVSPSFPECLRARDAAGAGSCRDFEYQWAGFFEVGKCHRIGCGGVGSEHVELVLVVEVIDVLQILRAEGFVVLTLLTA